MENWVWAVLSVPAESWPSALNKLVKASGAGSVPTMFGLVIK